MAIDFPAAPALNDQYTYQGKTWQWDGEKWILAGGTSAGHSIENEGTPLTARPSINFTGDGVTASDSGGKTVVNVPGGAGSLTSISAGLNPLLDIQTTGYQGIARANLNIPVGPLIGTWSFDSSTVAGASATRMRLNNSTLTSVTKMYVNELPGEGVSATEMAQYLDGVNANDVLELRVLGSTVLAAKFARFRVISSVDNGAYRTFEVVYVDHNGTIDNYDLVALSLFPSTIASPFVNDRTYSNIGSGFYIQPLYVGPAVFSTRERARGWRIPLVAGWTFAGITYSVVSQGSGTTIRAAVYSDIGVKVSATEVSAACGAAGTVNLTFSGNWTVPTTGEYIIGLGMTGGDATLTGATPIPQDLSTWSAQSAIVNPAAGASEAQSVISAGMPSTWNDGAAVLTDIALNPIAALRKA